MLGAEVSANVGAEATDILTFWAPFLLLHLGGPDTITSFSLEDNEFWIRHLLGLMLQIGLTIYFIFLSLPNNKLWLPTLLVLIAGIIKYAERNRAFYLASFDHFKVEQKEPPIQPFSQGHDELGLDESDIGPMGIIKNLLVGPLIHPNIRRINKEVFSQKRSEEVLLKIEIELSLLYEALHTKFPVVGCKIAYVFRIISLGCIFGALLSFGLISRHYQLGKFESRLTYGLLIGAITLDFISIGSLIFADFNLAFGKIPECKIVTWIKNRRRWSRRIPQCNLITCCVKDCPYWLNKLADFVHIRNVLDSIKLSRCSSSQHFSEEQEWRFILEEVKKKGCAAETVEQSIEICLRRGDGILDSNDEYRHLIWSVRNVDYTESLLTWHIATEICFQFQEDEDHRPTSSRNMDCRRISKLISDYMFYLLEVEPAMIAIVSNIHQKEVLREAINDLGTIFKDIRFLDGKEISKTIFTGRSNPPGCEKGSVLFLAQHLARQLRDLRVNFPWELMSQVWVEIMCYAAINCRPNVHAQQPAKGGQLLTFVWLLMNHLGIGTQFATQEDIGDQENIEPLLQLLRRRQPAH